MCAGSGASAARGGDANTRWGSGIATNLPKLGVWGGLCLQISGFGFTEEEKDDGLTMSVVSGEGTKSSPNGDRVEAQAAQTERPPKPGECSDLFSPDTVFVSGWWGWR